jgi:glycosyltransferase involved in cell wall biosynthesis
MKNINSIINTTTSIKKIAFIGDYLPRKCGIATFTHDLQEALAKQYPKIENVVAPVNDTSQGYDYPSVVRFEFQENDLDSYRRAADYLNFSEVDVVCLQHEYGIYGGPTGSFILTLLRDLRIPVVTTLHTILEQPNDDQRRVLQEICTLSSRLVVMSEYGAKILRALYCVPSDKIDLIAHPIIDMPFVDSNFYKDQFGAEGKHVLLTFGLLSPNKGIENVLSALPEVIQQIPNLLYIVLGATHPTILREQGEVYRLRLERMALDLGIEKHVSFYNRFVDQEELKVFLGVSDLYITPYQSSTQTTSGTLAYAFGSGKAVISTPYWHAEELLRDNKGVLVPFGDTSAMSTAIIDLLQDDPRRHAMRKRAYLLGREMIWSKAANHYMASFEKARRNPISPSVRHLAGSLTIRTLDRTLEEKQLDLPPLRLDHLTRLTDSTGIFQHAIYSLPDFTHGYCTDDNARALIATVLLEELKLGGSEVRRLGDIYASFMQYAFDPDIKRFRNFMSFDRRWLEVQGSEDSQGRALWALGLCAGRTLQPELHTWAAHLFERALPAVLEAGSPRTWAFTLLGIDEYFRRLSGDRVAAQAREVLTERLIDRFEKTAGTAENDWPWFENSLTYANARLPQVLLLSGHHMQHEKALEIGIRSLKWLVGVQKNEQQTHFRPIGSDGFYERGGTPAKFDQQAIEAHGMISACLTAYRITRDPYWQQEARITFEWFLGRNDLGISLYDPRMGGCCDGLHMDRVNQNQGAESTLAYLIAFSEMKAQELG